MRNGCSAARVQKFHRQPTPCCLHPPSGLGCFYPPPWHCTCPSILSYPPLAVPTCLPPFLSYPLAVPIGLPCVYDISPPSPLLLTHPPLAVPTLPLAVPTLPLLSPPSPCCLHPPSCKFFYPPPCCPHPPPCCPHPPPCCSDSRIFSKFPLKPLLLSSPSPLLPPPYPLGQGVFNGTLFNTCPLFFILNYSTCLPPFLFLLSICLSASILRHLGYFFMKFDLTYWASLIFHILSVYFLWYFLEIRLYSSSWSSLIFKPIVILITPTVLSFFSTFNTEHACRYLFITLLYN